jgi:hypothetical protein
MDMRPNIQEFKCRREVVALVIVTMGAFPGVLSIEEEGDSRV